MWQGWTACLVLAALRGAAGGSCGNWGDSDECAGGAITKRNPINSASTLQYSIFMAMQYYGPPEPLSSYHAIAAAAKKLDLPMEQVVVTVDKHANTSAASIPLALDMAVRDGRIQRGQMLLLEAFGGGFTWGSALLKY